MLLIVIEIVTWTDRRYLPRRRPSLLPGAHIVLVTGAVVRTARGPARGKEVGRRESRM